MAFDETNEGAAYLSALKNPGSPQATGTATVAAPAKAHFAETPTPANRPSPARVDEQVLRCPQPDDRDRPGLFDAHEHDGAVPLGGEQLLRYQRDCIGCRCERII